MFKWKMTIILKSGYEFKFRFRGALIPSFELTHGLHGFDFEKANKKFCIFTSEIAGYIIKPWYQAWS